MLFLSREQMEGWEEQSGASGLMATTAEDQRRWSPWLTVCVWAQTYIPGSEAKLARRPKTQDAKGLPPIP